MIEPQWSLTGVGQALRRLTVRVRGSRRATTISPVLTVGQVCRALHKSRRQVYRYLRMQRLQPCGRILGQWLVAQSEIDRFAHDQVPGHLRAFFWDAQLSSLSVTRHRDFILARLLEFGDREAARWVLRTYPRQALAAFLQGRGADVLSRRAWRFWASQLGLKAPRTPSRRVGAGVWRGTR